MLTKQTDADGYSTINLWRNNKPKKFRVSRLVATAFLPNPDELPQVHHRNMCRNDDRVENLDWQTAGHHGIIEDNISIIDPVANVITHMVYTWAEAADILGISIDYAKEIANKPGSRVLVF